MYPIVRVVKRIPDGSIWQRYRAYRLPDVRGVARVYLPGGTGWWNPLGGWVTAADSRGVNLFDAALPCTISCHGPEHAQRLYIDIDCRSPRAMRTESSDEPPCEMNGSGIPVTGMRLIAMPTLTTSWKASIENTPAPTNVPNGSRARNAMRSVATSSTA